MNTSSWKEGGVSQMWFLITCNLVGHGKWQLTKVLLLFICYVIILWSTFQSCFFVFSFIYKILAKNSTFVFQFGILKISFIIIFFVSFFSLKLTSNATKNEHQYFYKNLYWIVSSYNCIKEGNFAIFSCKSYFYKYFQNIVAFQISLEKLVFQRYISYISYNYQDYLPFVFHSHHNQCNKFR